MDLRELRIGNIINDKSDKGWGIVKVESILSSSLRVYCHSLNHEYLVDYWQGDLEPIPISPEWLERFGFRYYKYKSDSDDAPVTEEWSYDNGLCAIVQWDNDGKFWLSNSFSFKLRVEVKTVHQLQNLIFAICGKELDLTPVSKQ